MTSKSRLSGRAFHNDESRAQARHLLRALLREASYLPDATVRTFAHHRVVARYRDYPEHHASFSDRFDALIKLGGKNLRQLQRANNGELRGLERVFEQTYGREGKRRYELMKPLFIEQAPSEHSPLRSAVQPTKHDIYGHPLHLPQPLEGPYLTKKETLQFRFSDRFPYLKTLILNQSRQSEHLYGERHIRSATFEIPLKNLWQRTQPRKRQINAASKWYADTLDKVLPPLPEDEWARLKKLAMGEVPWTGPPRRRPAKRLTSTPNVGSDAALDLLAGGSQNRPPDIDGVSVSALLEDELQIKPVRKQLQLRDGRDVGHAITPRLMRRLYANVLSLCPLMRFDKDTATCTIEWFDPKLNRTEPHAQTAPSRSDDKTEAQDTNAPEKLEDDLPLLFGTGAVEVVKQAQRR